MAHHNIRSMHVMSDFSTYVTPEELARRYGIGVSTIYGWKLRGIGPRWLKLGGALRYRSEDVAAWEEQNSRPAAP